MPWKFIDPRSVDPRLFGLSEVYAVKVKKFDGQGDVRCFRLRGWAIFADLMDTDPRMGRQLDRSEWFVFAAKGRREDMYSPKIDESLIPDLYRMARDQGVPMTRLVYQIISKETRKQKRKITKGGEADDCFKREGRAEEPG